MALNQYFRASYFSPDQSRAVHPTHTNINYEDIIVLILRVLDKAMSHV